MADMSPRKRSLWLRFLDRTNLTVTALTAGTILYTRSAGVVYFAAGASACMITAKLTKKVIRQPRPVSPHSHKKTYGMPSTHSASISFYATYITLASFYLPFHFTLAPASPWLRVLAPLVALPSGATILASRVWLGHHTWAQVFAGAMLGLLFAGAWFELWTRGLNEIGGLVEDALAPYVRW